MCFSMALYEWMLLGDISPTGSKSNVFSTPPRISCSIDTWPKSSNRLNAFASSIVINALSETNSGLAVSSNM